MIVSDVKERKRKWHWDYIGDRANARENYIRMYKKLKSQGEDKVILQSTTKVLTATS